MSTNTLPQNWVEWGSDTIVASVSADGVTFTQPLSLIASVTALTSTEAAAVAAGTNIAVYGSANLISLTVNGTTYKILAFTNGTK